ncbi:MAG: AAA family ATPase [Gaiellaceae bacterium]
MRLAIIGPSGSGKTTLAVELAALLGVRHVEIDALHHGPNWESCGPDVLRERVAAATEGDGWISDGTYHTMIGDLVLERAETIAWLDLPVGLVLWRLLRRTHARNRSKVVLWNGNVEPGWRASLRWLIWPALKRAFENRRALPVRLARHPHLAVQRLRSAADVRAFVQSIQATASTSGSSNGSERQKTPPLSDT